MKKFLFIVVILVVAVGLWRGWFSFSSSSDDGSTGVTLSVDKDKIQTDKEALEKKVDDVGGQGADKPAPLGGK